MKPIELLRSSEGKYWYDEIVAHYKFVSSHPELMCTVENIEEAFRQLEVMNDKIYSVPRTFIKSKELSRDYKKLLSYIRVSIKQLRKDIKYYEKCS